jgi:hypothetical protein
VIEDPLEQGDVELLPIPLREVVEVEAFEADPVARPLAVLEQESRLINPVIANVEPEAGSGAELLHPERVGTAVAGAIEERAALQAFRIDLPHLILKGDTRVEKADRTHRLGVCVVCALGRFQERTRAQLRCHLDIEVPRPEPDDLLLELGRGLG